MPARRPDRRPARRDEDAVRTFVEHMSMNLADAGFPRMPARVLVAMTAAEEGTLGAAELAGRLGVSPAAISGAVRYLVHLGMLERAPVPGSRREAYRIPDEGWYTASMARQGTYADFAEIADSGVRALGGQRTSAGARVAQMRDFFLFVQRETDDLLTRWEKERSRVAGGGSTSRARG